MRKYTAYLDYPFGPISNDGPTLVSRANSCDAPVLLRKRLLGLSPVYGIHEENRWGGDGGRRDDRCPGVARGHEAFEDMSCQPG